MVLSDIDIEELVTTHAMIDPFIQTQVRVEGGRRVVSYGLSSAGYDIRLAPEFQVFTDTYSTVVDPKSVNPRSLVKFNEEDLLLHTDGSKYLIIPPNSYILGRSLEYIRMPRHIKANCLGKSTLARVALSINVTPLEPGWEGFITMEIGNNSRLPVMVYANEGIAQLEFIPLSSPCRVSYSDRGGKYHKAQGIQLANV